MTKNRIALKGGTLIDGTSRPPIPDAVIEIQENLIKSVSSGGKTNFDDDTCVIDCEGNTVLPGFIDMHVHVEYQGMLGLFLANGITTVRDMGNSMQMIKELKAKLKGRQIVGPRFFATGPLLDGPNPYWPDTIVIEKETDVETALENLARESVDFVKVYDKLPPAILKMIIREAHRRGLRVAGHIGQASTVTEAVNEGLDFVEHMCFGKELATEGTYEDTYLSTWQGWKDVNVGSKKVAEFVELLARKRVYLTPTLVVEEKTAWNDDPAIERDPNLRLMPESKLKVWRENPWCKGLDAEGFAEAKSIVRKMMQVAVIAHRMGVNILVGTDTPNPYVIPGFSFHRELELLVEAGFSPKEVLLSATSLAGHVVDRNGELGTVEPRKLADLVVVNGDPLTRISDTANVETVIANGVIFTREELMQLVEPSMP